MSRDTLDWEYGITTHPGAVRDINEDSAILKVTKNANGEELMLLTVADGMGGYQAGDVASQVITGRLNTWWDQRIQSIIVSQHPLKTIEEELVAFIHEIDSDLIQYGINYGKHLGTTASILVLYQNEYLICHVGDSRIYHITDISNERDASSEIYQTEIETAPLVGKMTMNQLTEDHSWVESQVKLGMLTRSQAAKHEKRNVLLQCLGIKPGVTPFISKGSYSLNDWFLLCSDGFYTMFPDEQILSLILNNNNDLQVISEQLVQQANHAGATDNVTVLLIKNPSVLSESNWQGRVVNFFKRKN